MDSLTLTDRIRAGYDALSPQLQQAARYLLSHPEEAALASMRRLADLSGVSPASMVRLAQALGYPGWNELREQVREQMRNGEPLFVDRARRLQGRDARTEERLIQDMVVADTVALRDLLITVGSERLAACRDTILSARRVYVLGLRSSYSVAFLFHYTYSLFRDNAVLLDGHGGTFADSLRHVGPRDVLVAISLPPYTRETVSAADFAAGEGAAVVAITDGANSPLAGVARHVLTVSHESPSFFQSLVPSLALVQMLAASLAAGSGPDTLAALAASERQLKGLNAYWEPGDIP
ncbi:MurR/RpiR family transcriptional regulator [Telmatospirillum sp. J64-1]|uniref:MurR/RpiR family transcriptional regulator n=1 Tax=Telmatospirillum sp. J64-1 TaxID=2502183 RepID=UPI00163DB222|nr:MurR/RpiR family transcriptional regulator [Telmatospirillum sp. J64-1]